MHVPLRSFLLAALWPALARAYSFNITAIPKQCQDFSLQISGSDGKPPYSALIIPFGPTPLPNAVEARLIENQNFSGQSTSLTFKLKYPTNSQFLIVVSDANKFGSGGTSVAATVLSSSDSSCFDSSKSVHPSFSFSIEPTNQIVQCQQTRIWWDPATVQGTPDFLGVIPGGQSFQIPITQTTTVPDQGLGFNWTPNVRGGSSFLLVGGDNRGPGSAGSAPFTVGSGTTNDNSCLNSNSPSSTPGSPAGGTYPTSSSGAGTGPGGGGNPSDPSSSNSGTTTSSSGGGTNVGAIVGGVLGGAAFAGILGLLALFVHRRKKKARRAEKERPVDLLQGDDDDRPDNLRGLPQFYTPEPFVVPDPAMTEVSSARAAEDGQGASTRPPSAFPGAGRPTHTPRVSSESGYVASGSASEATPSSAPRTSKSALAGPSRMRPVNIIQHDDAGPSTGEEADASAEETVELPPAYTNIRK